MYLAYAFRHGLLGSEIRPGVVAERVTTQESKTAHVMASREQAQGRYGGETHP